MKLLVQPGDGVAPLVDAIQRAKKSVEVAVFRFDRPEIEKALENAVQRGVSVHALIAHTNRGGEKTLRRLEMRLLEAGATVARTADNLLRYHDKMMIVDRTELYVLAFNFTYLDIEHSRSFGVITKNRALVQEAVKLFEADTQRQTYTAGLSAFIVSPVNARKELSAFIRGAKKELLIYDVEIADAAMIKVLEQRAAAGVDIRVIGRIDGKSAGLTARALPGLRLHTRMIVRDRTHAFLGSQSLREAELDERREVGILFRDAKVVGRMIKVFEDDWTSAGLASEMAAKAEGAPLAAKAAKRAAKTIVSELPSVTPALEEAVKEVVGETPDVALDTAQMEEAVRDAVKDAVKSVVKQALKQAATDGRVDLPVPATPDGTAKGTSKTK